jgi:alpha-L-fucosidase
MGLWNFINVEATRNVRPWHINREGDIYLTRAKEADTVYAIDTSESWEWGVPKTITLQSVQASDDSEIEILGQSGDVLEYTMEIPKATWQQDEVGLHITATRGQRLYNDKTWPNPVVIKITHAQPA